MTYQKTVGCLCTDLANWVNNQIVSNDQLVVEEVEHTALATDKWGGNNG